MAKIFVSTNKDQSYNCMEKSLHDKLTELWKTMINNTITIDQEIILVKDDLDDPIGLNIDKEYDYLLFHSKTADNIRSQFKLVKTLKSQHGKNTGYTTFYRILLGNQNEKVERIKKYVFEVVKKNNIEITGHEVQEAYKCLLKCITINILKQKNGQSFDWCNTDKNIEIILNYFDSVTYIQSSADSLKTLNNPVEYYERNYEALKRINAEIF
jgi:hypothetical protein